MLTIYPPSAMRTKVIGKRFGPIALKAGLDFIKEVVVEKKSPKQAVKSIAMNRLNKAFTQPNKKPIKKAGKKNKQFNFSYATR